MPARWIDYLPLDDLVRAPRNPKAHDMAGLAASVDRFGYVEPITLDDRTGRLVAGHGRLDHLLAARAEGADPPEGIEVDDDGHWLAPVVRGWRSRSDADAEGYLVTSNRQVELGGWVQDELGALLTDLAAQPLGLVGTGYDADDLDKLLASLVPVRGHERNLRPDVEQQPPATPVTKPGDLWLMGEHRLLCGDAGSDEDHARLLDGVTCDLVLTDPPYGIGLEYGDLVDDDADAVRELIARFMPLVLRHKAVLLTPGQVCMWDYPRPTWTLGWVHPASNSSGPWGFNLLNPVLAYGPDPYLAAGMGRRPSAVVMSADNNEDQEHPVPKPPKVWAWLMERGTIGEGRSVLDPFMGSGTTLVVGEQLRRRVYGMELEPRWCDAACARWQQLTGQRPQLERTGRRHDFTKPS